MHYLFLWDVPTRQVNVIESVYDFVQGKFAEERTRPKAGPKTTEAGVLNTDTSWRDCPARVEKAARDPSTAGVHGPLEPCHV